MTDALARLDSLHGGFRHAYLTNDAIDAQLDAWARAFPDVARVHEIGRSHEGRALRVLTLGREPDRVRPAVWVDGNMHAGELCGSSVALAIAEDVLRLLLEPGATVQGLSASAAARVADTLFYVLPRISVDGAHAVLDNGRYVRSNPRDRRHERVRAHWVGADVDGNGEALLMRRMDPGGEYVESREVAGLMVPRTIDDAGPYYKLYPEGFIENFDGTTIPDPHFLSDNDVDLNRNFPYSWTVEPEQAGAGAHPLSEPEAHAIVTFAVAHPEIFAWLNLHTFGGVYIRPLGFAPDSKMEPFDLAVYRQVAEWGLTYGGYPTVSGFHEFLYEPEKPLRGDLSEWAYHHRGAIAYVCELWDLFAQLGIARRTPFVDHYTHLTAGDLATLAKWDREHNRGRIFRTWNRCRHSQLGDVETGGMDPRVGITNPPYERIAEICDRQSQAFLRVAALGCALRLGEPAFERLGGELTRVSVLLRNEGYLPTWGLAVARGLPWNSALRISTRTDGCTVVAGETSGGELGHLNGWGRGLNGPDQSIFHQRSRGNGSERMLSWVVRGAGELHVTVAGPRVGSVQRTVAVP